MKRNLLCVFMFFNIMLLCSCKTELRPERTAEQQEISDEISEQVILSSPSPLYKIDISEYDKYEIAETVPTVDQLTEYLESTVLFHDAVINGNIELWAIHLDDDPYIIRNTQLITYPILLKNAKMYFGVDRNTGIVYSWSEDIPKDLPEQVESPEIFPTPLSAVEYVKNVFWDASKFIVPFELELMPGNPDSEYEDRYPYYKSQTIPFNDWQTSTYYISVDHVDDESYTIHSYEVVMDSPEEGHTATTSWLKVYKNGFIVDELLDNRWVANEIK